MRQGALLVVWHTEAILAAPLRVIAPPADRTAYISAIAALIHIKGKFGRTGYKFEFGSKRGLFPNAT